MKSALHTRWQKYWSFSSSISPSSEYSGLISFRIEWFDLLAVQGTLKSLFQHHSSKASVLWHSAFFIVQLSQLYLTTGKTISSVQFSSVSQSCPTVCNPVDCSTPSFLVHHWSWLKLISIELVMPSNHLILCRLFLLSILPSIRLFSNDQFFASGGQSIGASASAPVLLMNIQD